jgi:hypothetical protein
MELFNSCAVKMGGVMYPGRTGATAGKGPSLLVRWFDGQPMLRVPARIGDEGKAVGLPASGFAVTSLILSRGS